MIRLIYFLIPLVFIGCGGGSGSSSPSSAASVTATLIDSPVSGVGYSCGELSGVTDSEGNFTCNENTTVSFNIGGISLGSMNMLSTKTQITPSVLYGLSSNNITDGRVLNFIRLVQSLDSDSNASNGIDITQSIRDSLKESTIDISNTQTTQADINTSLVNIGKTLISQSEALAHYIDTLTNSLNIVLEDEPLYNEQWYINYDSSFFSQNQIDSDAHINGGDYLHSYSGKGVKVAVIDDGLDVNHEDLEEAIIGTYNAQGGVEDVSQSGFYDSHGTAVTGIIGARVNGKGIKGIAYQSDIIFLKYKTYMTDSETIELFNKAEEFGADIINCSWGTNDVSQAVKEKIQDLAANGRDGKGTIIVFSSGNDNQDMGNDESSIPEVVAVGATNKDNLLSSYSNFGDNLDVVAPGGESLGITTIDPIGEYGASSDNGDYLVYNDPYSFVGTSASAPIISGAIALLLEKDPNITRSEVEALIQTTGDKIGPHTYVEGRNNYYGYGKINLSNLLAD